MERSDVTGSRKQALLALAALVLMLLAVAVASTGSVPSGTGTTRRLSGQFIDVLVSLYLVVMIVATGIWAYILLIRRDVVAEALANRPRQSLWISTVTFVLVVVLLAVFVRWVWLSEGLRRRLESIGSPTHAGSSSKGELGRAGEYEPRFATGPVLVVLTLLAVALVAWYLSYRARRRGREPVSDALLPALTDVLEETVDDLRAESDPRRAVIAAYARMERTLAAYGLPRLPAEAPAEYLRRIFTDLDVSGPATSRLTALFAWAKFSGHDVAAEMKQDAIDALEALRDELRAAEILAERQRAATAAERRERAAS
jgi:hypothetical protein